MPASVVAEGGCEYEIRVEKSSRTSETGHHRIELTELHSPQEQDRTQLQADTEFYERSSMNVSKTGKMSFKRLAAISGLPGSGAPCIAASMEKVGTKDYSCCTAIPKRSNRSTGPDAQPGRDHAPGNVLSTVARGSDQHWHTLEAVRSCCPRFRAACMPAETRSLISSRSNCAMAPIASPWRQ